MLNDRARDLLATRNIGVLATVSIRYPGFPFASVTPYALDENGQPLFLMSRLAVHTKNLLEHPEASLLVYDPEIEQDPLGSPRLNALGTVAVVPAEQLESAQSVYLEKHSQASQWISFGDFNLYRLTIQNIYYIGGFGQMGWVSNP